MARDAACVDDTPCKWNQSARHVDGMQPLLPADPAFGATRRLVWFQMQLVLPANPAFGAKRGLAWRGMQPV